MGHAVEQAARESGEFQLHWVGDRTPSADELRGAEVAIEFSRPEAAAANILRCFDAGVKVVCGTTGWNDRLPAVRDECLSGNHGIVYASNFSIGMNLLFYLNQHLAELMDSQPQYDVQIEETHHLQKLDKPSGTAIILASQILNKLKRKEQWVNEARGMPADLVILSNREADVPGTHVIRYTGPEDILELKHIALNRMGFARGALVAARWIKGKTGFYSMADVLGLNANT